MKRYREISTAEAITRDNVYMLVPLADEMTIGQLRNAEGFVLMEEEETEKKKIDHGRIVALSKAGRSIKWIADDIGCSEQTVRNHLAMEKEA